MEQLQRSNDGAPLPNKEEITRDEKKARKSRRTTSAPPSPRSARFFLAAEGSGHDGAPLVLGEEIATEDEVMVAAFKKDIPFYRVETWRARTEKKGRNMVLRKQS